MKNQSTFFLPQEVSEYSKVSEERNTQNHSVWSLSKFVLLFLSGKRVYVREGVMIIMITITVLKR